MDISVPNAPQLYTASGAAVATNSSSLGSNSIFSDDQMSEAVMPPSSNSLPIRASEPLFEITQNIPNPSTAFSDTTSSHTSQPALESSVGGTTGNVNIATFTRDESELIPSIQAISPVRYFGKFELSKHGKRSVLVYRIPNTRMVYSFSFLRKNNTFDVYRCIRCQSQGSYVKIKVVGNEFRENPCSIGHICPSQTVAFDANIRKFYEEMQSVRGDSNSSGMRVKQIWYKGLREREESRTESDEAVHDGVVSEYYGIGFEMRKRQIARNLAIHKDKRATMANVPSDLQCLCDGTLFLQEQSERFHIYFSERTIQKACSVGLNVLVADGVHSAQPKELARSGQLYSVHGVCGNGVELEGCSFHMAQAWNRRKDKLGLRQYLCGPTRERRISRWWEMLKGLVFLPKRLRARVRALEGPPVPRRHDAYRKCARFLRYLRNTWLSGMYKNLWCKWKKFEMRTTNLAEAFHSSLQKILNCDHPPLGTLIRVLKDLDLEAKCALYRAERMPLERKRLRRRDVLRREKITAEMMSFDHRLRMGQLRNHQVEKYCIRMARFVSNKSI
ncbi:unnamed protein product [Cylicocyclus nassatus]|uniref:Uncharacterized protein n=1 Tax=Cylicocyclus nassatus TaxID=53992 RepID=A0AA36DTG1_CYLNA|nr:unnamed protein product [Cylicocyclus nassatus]